MRARVVALLVVLVVLAPAAVPGSPAHASARPGVMRVLAGHHLADDLEARLDTMLAEERVPAVVVTTSAVDPARDFADAGSFQATQNYHRAPFGFAASLTAAQVQQLVGDARVASVWLDEPIHADLSTAVPSFGVTKARADFGVDGDGDGNPASYSAADSTVCIIDTGIDASHQDLNGGKVIGWKDFVNGRSTPYDDNGHGSHVAGIVAGTGAASGGTIKGVAPAAALVGVKVLDSSGSGSLSNVQAGVQWCIDNKALYGITVISLSLGTSQPSDGQDSLSLAVNSAVDAGILCSIAAGNSGPDAQTMGSPGAAAKALTVAAMADTGTGSSKQGFYLASFSSRGPTVDGRTKPDIAAPGVAITSVKANSGSGYVAFSGTSMATPFVSGVAALLLGKGVNAADARNALVTTAQDWGASGQDNDFGWGRLRAYDALRQGLNRTGSDPAEPAHVTRSGTLKASGTKTLLPVLVTATQDPLALTLLVPSASFAVNADLYLYAPGADTSSHANAVASSTSSSRQDTLHRLPSTGLYHAEVYASIASVPVSWTLDFSGDLVVDTTPPVTSLSTSGTRGTGGWFLGPVTVTLNATDDNAGVSSTTYRLDGGAAQTYTGPFVITGDGTHNVTYGSTDKTGNVETTQSTQMRLDSIAPQSSANLRGMQGNAGWFRSAVNATLTATDATSGVNRTRVSLDGAAETTFNTSLTVQGDGVHDLAFHSLDKAGNDEATRHTAVPIDTTPPVSVPSFAGPLGLAGWFVGPVDIGIVATDATSGVDPQGSTLSIDGTRAPFTGLRTVTQDGRHAILVASRDIAGNQEADEASTLRLDATPPLSTLSIGQPQAPPRSQDDVLYVDNTTRLTLQGSDALSGVAQLQQRLLDAWVTLPLSANATSAFNLDVPDRFLTVETRALDVAGNVEATHSLRLFVDDTPPQIEATSPLRGSVWVLDQSLGPLPQVPALAGTPASSVLVVAGAQVRVAADALDPIVNGGASGMARVDVRLDGTLLATLTAEPFTWTWDTTHVALGGHTLTLQAYDRLGHATSAPGIPVTVL